MKQYLVIHTDNRLNYVDMKSVTKLFVALGIGYLVYHKKIKYSDKIIQYVSEFKYSQVDILQIIQHTSGLNDDWSTKVGEEYIMSDLYKEYDKSKNSYKFILERLTQVYSVGEFHYNNFAYDILLMIIQKITNISPKQFLKKILFGPLQIKFDWYEVNKYFRGGYGLCINTSDIFKLSGLHMFMQSINYEHQQLYENLTIGSITYFGHSGSGGQFIYFTPNFDKLFVIISSNNPDEIPECDQLNAKKIIKKLS